jgi:hypothetical protein
MNETEVNRTLPSDDQVETVEREISDRYPGWTLVSSSANANGNVEESWRAERHVNSIAVDAMGPAPGGCMPPSKASSNVSALSRNRYT